MEFKGNQAIYLQIGDYVCEQILLGRWNAHDRVLSVRELGAALQVNPNTVMRTFEFLLSIDIIYNKRGVGYFVEEQATGKIIDYRRKQFLEHELPVLFKNMNLLGMTFEELKIQYELYNKNYH